jgi:hypothetical protein
MPELSGAWVLVDHGADPDLAGRWLCEASRHGSQHLADYDTASVLCTGATREEARARAADAAWEAEVLGNLPSWLARRAAWWRDLQPLLDRWEAETDEA